MLEIHAEQVYFDRHSSPACSSRWSVNNRLRNVPAEGIYNWDPGAFFGIYRPDTFWFGGAGAHGRGRVSGGRC